MVPAIVFVALNRRHVVAGDPAHVACGNRLGLPPMLLVVARVCGGGDRVKVKADGRRWGGGHLVDHCVAGPRRPLCTPFLFPALYLDTRSWSPFLKDISFSVRAL